MTDLLSTLIGPTGRYCGESSDPTGEHAAGRGDLTLSALPGGAGVVLLHEVRAPDGELNHSEHTMIARTPRGIELLTTHGHADVATRMVEVESGSFEVPDDEEPPFPMAIRLEIPERGRLVYRWSYGFGDQPLQERDVADLRLVSDA